MICFKLFGQLGVPIGTSNFKHDTSDYLAAASMLNSSINNAIQAGDGYKQRQQASEFFYRNLEEQWKAIKEQERYNSPLNQRMMFESAGFSPYAMLGNSSSIAPTVGSSIQVPQTIPNFDNGAFDRASNILNSTKVADAQVANMHQQTVGMSIDNFSRDAKNHALINELLANAGFSDAKSVGQNYSNLVAQNSIGSLIAANAEQVNLIRSQIAQNYASESYTNSLKLKVDKETSWVDAISRGTLSKLASDVATNASLQGLNYEQAKYMIANRFKVEAEQRGIDLSNSRFEQVTPFFVSESMYKSMQEQSKAFNYMYYGTGERKP